MKRIKLSLAIILLTAMGLYAQDTKEFTPSGSAFAKIFTNFHTGIGAANQDQGFELQRAYLGYKYEFAKGFTGNLTFDVGAPGNDSNLENTAYVKNAMINYKEGNFSLDFGLISTKAFKEQEDFWGARYLYKSFQDQNKYNTSADMGVSASYQLIEALSVDATITNGEGYKNLQKDNKYRYGAGITYKKEGLLLRVYTDIYSKNDENLDNQSTLALFAAYKAKEFSIGAEYNMLRNEKFVKEHNLSGYSIYSTYKTSAKTQIFARYDKSLSKDDWNEAKDASTVIAGIEYSPNKNIKIAPNYQLSNPSKDGIDSKSYAYLSLQIAF